jgi:chromosome segregation ATPase
VRRKASEGTLPAFRVEGTVREEWRFHRSDVEAYKEGRDEGTTDGRTDALAVRHFERIAAMQQRQVEASETLADRLGDLADLRDVLQLSAEAQANAANEVRALTKIIEQQQEELKGLREELAAERAERGRDENRSWWRRLLGEVGGQDRDD